MSFIIENSKLSIDYCGKVITDVTVALEIVNNHNNHIEITNGAWRIEGENAIAPIGQAGKLVLTTENSAFGMVLSAQIETGTAEHFENVFNWHIRCRLPHNPTVVIYNEGTYDPGKCILDMTAKAITTALVTDQEVTGVDYVAYRAGTDQFGVVGAISFEHYFMNIGLSENGAISIAVAINEPLRETVTLESNSIYTTDAILICIQNTDALPAYGKAIAEYSGSRKKFTAPAGWCSWYYYLSEVSENVVLENVSVAHEKNLPFRYIQIDDGWENNKGDWLPNEKFPSGRMSLANAIKEKGFLPGIWVSPFLFETASEVYQKNPQWFIHDNLVNYKGYAFIDYSCEEAQDYLRKLFHTLSVEWGYRYIKVDLVSWILALKGYQNGFNALKNYRLGMKLIRDSVTEDTMILSCTAPLSASAPYADGTRISMDIFDKWESLKDVARQSLKRLFVNEYLIIDPDCIMLRNSEEEDAECRRFCLRNDTEIETFMVFVSVTGGAIMNSDKLSLLDERDLNRIRALTPVNTKPATVLDLYDRELPSYFSYGHRGKFDMYAFINWTDQEQTFSLGLSEVRYQRGYFGAVDYGRSDRISIHLNPHASQIIYTASEKSDFDELKNSIMPQ